MEIESRLVDGFGNRVRVRVCGLFCEGNRLLLIKHKGLGTGGELWLPPGGGVGFGEPAEEALRREFLEETGLKVQVGEFLFVNEFMDKSLHAIELFFEVKRIDGSLTMGTDPELSAKEQIITDLKMLTYDEIHAMNKGCVHRVVAESRSLEDLLSAHGFFSFPSFGRR